jgi:hypothetical protein
LAWIKIISSALVLAGTAFGLARGAAKSQIDASVLKIINDASEIARERVKSGASTYLRDAWRHFLITTAVKSFLLVSLMTMNYSELLSQSVELGLAVLFVVSAIIYDVFERRLVILSVYRLTRKHGLHPKKIVRLTVARRVFDEVLAQYHTQKATKVRAALMRLGGRSDDELSLKVANVVSETAAASAWDDVAPFAKAAFIRFAILFFAYTLFATFILWNLI